MNSVIIIINYYYNELSNEKMCNPGWFKFDLPFTFSDVMNKLAYWDLDSAGSPSLYGIYLHDLTDKILNISFNTHNVKFSAWYTFK
jgi:hypothetical protein